LPTRSHQKTRTTQHGEREQVAALLDVELLDLLAQIESLLRAGRSVQREALSVRGVPVAHTPARRAAAAAKIEQIIQAMARDHRDVGKVIATLLGCARASASPFRPSVVKDLISTLHERRGSRAVASAVTPPFLPAIFHGSQPASGRLRERLWPVAFRLRSEAGECLGARRAEQ
jgi:hypothetical protein